MIIQSSHGSLVLFWNDKLVCGFPLSKSNTLLSYFHQSNEVVKQYLKEGNDFKKMKQDFNVYCNSIYNKKINNKKISSKDLQLFCCCILGLIRIKQVDFDNHILIAPRKKNVNKPIKKFKFIKDEDEIYYKKNTVLDEKLFDKFTYGSSQHIKR